MALLTDTPGTADDLRDAERIASLPVLMRGIGFQCAGRCAPVAYWASWADALQPALSNNRRLGG